MRNKLICTIVLLVSVTGLTWSQFWKDFSEKDRKTVGESYWLAGKQYQSVGKTDKGSDYMALARLIYPQLDPSNIADQSQLSAAELLARGKAGLIAGGGTIPTQTLDSFFLRFVGALLDEDAASVAGFLDGSVYLSDIPAELSRADAQAQFDALFAGVSLDGLAPSALYDLSSVVVDRAPPVVSAAWGETYTLRVDAAADFSQFVNFWEKKQQFFIRRVGADWQIAAMGQALPPAQWAPQAAEAAPAPAPVAVDTDAKASKAIIEAFTGFLSAYLAKDAEGALAFIGDEVRFMRLRQTVTRQELATTLPGYFAGAEFAVTEVGEAVDMDSAFVEQTESPIEGMNGPVYQLSLQAKADLSASIPFWTSYQRYYFYEAEDGWKVFALL